MASTPTVVTDQQVYEFLKYLVNLVPTLYVDDDGYPRTKSNNELIYTGVDNGNTNSESKIKKPLILYGAPKITNECHVLNPFVEGMAHSAVSSWFDTIITLSASNYLRWLQKTFILASIEAKSKKKANSMNLELANLIASWIDKIDETTLKELEQLTTNLRDYFNIFYLPRKRMARVFCGLIENEEFRIVHKKVREKTWDVLTDMVKHIFDTDDFSEYTVVSKIQGCPKFDATLRVLYKVLVMLNRYLQYLPEDAKSNMNMDDFNLDYLSTSIDLLDLFRVKAKYLVPTVTSNVSTEMPKVNNPLNQVQSVVGVPGFQSSFMNAPVGLPGQTNPFFNGQYNTPTTTPIMPGGVGIPGIPNMNGFNVGLPSVGVPMAQSPIQPPQFTTSIVNSGLFGKTI